ncbi:MAG: aldehyde ferredoxin oxidoreductase family protein [Bacillota bacterium]
MMKGYAGRILRVDLDDGTIEEEAITEHLARTYVGGRGLAARRMYRELEPDTDPLGPDNLFILATGPLAGTGIAGSTRHMTATKSPLTGGWGESNAAGRFGPMLKASGYDAIVIRGRAEQPVYLYVLDGRAKIRNCGETWGKFIGDTRDDILKETHPRAEVAAIGPAGENLCKFASVISENNRAAGRSGTGAVMGSKNLKAVAVYGSKETELADPDRMDQLRRTIIQMCLEHPGCQGFRENGTAGAVGSHNAMGMYPAYNFREGVSDDIDRVDGPTMTRLILKSRQACNGCPVACRRVVQVDEGSLTVDPRYGGPEFETIGSIGTCTGLYDIRAIAKANELCNKYGVDTINTGLSIAWAMECYERGILTPADTGGMKLTWGDADLIFALIADISLRRGLGELLAEGLKVASEKVGQGSADFAMQVKNQAFPVHMPRGKVGQGLSYATSNRGACHTQGMHDTTFEGGNIMPEIGFTEKFRGLSRTAHRLKPEAEMLAQNYRAIQDSLIICRFTSWDYGPTPPSMLAEAARAATGLEFTPADLMLVGERVFNLCRLFNTREGFDRRADTLPRRLAESLPRGATASSTITEQDLNEMLDEYYSLRGWDDNGVPTEETLQRLGLNGKTD